jgi:hypothetical protein
VVRVPHTGRDARLLFMRRAPRPRQRVDLEGRRACRSTTLQHCKGSKGKCRRASLACSRPRPWKARACLISWPCKAWLGSQSLASHSPANDGQAACLIGVAKLSQAEAFFVFDCSRQPGPRPTTKPGHCLIRSKPRPARATDLHMRGRGEETSRGSSHNITNQH